MSPSFLYLSPLCPLPSPVSALYSCCAPVSNHSYCAPVFQYICPFCPPQKFWCTMSSSFVSVHIVLFLILHLHQCPPSLFLYICPSFLLPSPVLSRCINLLCSPCSPPSPVSNVISLCFCPPCLHPVSSCPHCILSTPFFHISVHHIPFNLCPPCPLPIYFSSVK